MEYALTDQLVAMDPGDFGTAPREMFVWNDGCSAAYRRYVIGHINGKWVAHMKSRAGVLNWDYACDLPKDDAAWDA